MKKMLRIAVLVIASMAAMASCSLLSGKAGDAYVQMTYNSAADGMLISAEGFPLSFYTAQDYLIEPGTYNVLYVLYYSTLSTWYTTYTNDTNGTFITGGSSVSNNLSFYTSNGYFDAYANTYSYTITVNKGSFPFRDGTDKYFSIYLGWDPAYTEVSSANVAASEAKIIEDSADRIVKELTDGDHTLRLEIKKGSVPAPKSLKNMK
jgi:hypothetical protein